MGKEIDISKTLLSRKTPFTPEMVAKEYSLEVNAVKTVFDSLVENGYRFVNVDGLYLRSKSHEGGANFDASKMFRGGLLHFGLVADTHLGSKFERLDALEVMYDRFQQNGVKVVFHCGDLTDGSNVYRGQEFEQDVMGQEAQIQYAIKKYPKRGGINTVVISGNHDCKMYERGGADPMVQIARARKDITYIGQYAARVKMGGQVNMDMLHPMGSQSYAVSYRAQKAINAMNPADLPNIMAWGHYHNSLYVNYRGVDFVQVPCFKDQSLQFERRLGMTSNIGGWIVDGKTNGERVEEFTPRLVTFGKKR